MKPLESFFSRILPLTPNCPDPLAAQAVLDSAIEFCERSNALRYNVDTFTTVEGQSAYDIDVPNNHTLARVVYLTVNGTELTGLVAEKLPNYSQENATPYRYYVSQNESELQLNLYPAPDAVYNVNMSLALKPSYTARYLEDDLYDYWNDAIVAGALYRLKVVPGQPFSDPAGALYYDRRAKILCHQARVESNIGRVIGSMDVRPRPLV